MSIQVIWTTDYQNYHFCKSDNYPFFWSTNKGKIATFLSKEEALEQLVKLGGFPRIHKQSKYPPHYRLRSYISGKGYFNDTQSDKFERINVHDLNMRIRIRNEELKIERLEFEKNNPSFLKRILNKMNSIFNYLTGNN